MTTTNTSSNGPLSIRVTAVAFVIFAVFVGTAIYRINQWQSYGTTTGTVTTVEDRFLDEGRRTSLVTAIVDGETVTEIVDADNPAAGEVITFRTRGDAIVSADSYHEAVGDAQTAVILGGIFALVAGVMAFAGIAGQLEAHKENRRGRERHLRAVA